MLLDGSELSSCNHSFPGFNINEVEKLKQIHVTIVEEKMKKLNANNKENQYSDPESDNVYAEVADPGEETPVADLTT